MITNVAHDSEADLIVLTTHGHTGFKHVFMGSTAERVVTARTVSSTRRPKMRTRVGVDNEVTHSFASRQRVSYL